MQMDKQNELGDAQAFTTGTTVSTNAYDLGAVGHDPSIGRRLAALFVVSTAAGGTTPATSYDLQIIQSATSNLATPDVLATRNVLVAAAIADAVFEVPLPAGVVTKRYLGVQVVTNAGTAPTISMSSYLVPQDEIPKFKAFSKVYTTI